MSIDITIEEMEALPAESYELFDIRGEIERAHGILPNSTASSAERGTPQGGAPCDKSQRPGGRIRSRTGRHTPPARRGPCP